MFNVASYCYIEHVSLTVTDEVWHQLNPGAGRLSRRAAVKAWIAVALALALVTAGVAGWQSGIVVAHLRWGVWGVHATEPPSDVVSVDVEIDNDGLAPVTIAGVGRSGPGLDLVRSQGVFPVRVGPAKGIRVTLVYRITDCGQVPVGSWPVAVRVDRSWGVQIVNPRSLGGDDFPWGRSVTDSWCHNH